MIFFWKYFDASFVLTKHDGLWSLRNAMEKTRE
jgi:hypothetical protein